MLRVLKWCLVLLLLVTGVLATGCVSNTPHSTLVATTQGPTCTKCQVTRVKLRETSGRGRVIGYYWSLQDICPDCYDGLQSFLVARKFQHTCRTCGDATEICQRHER